MAPRFSLLASFVLASSLALAGCDPQMPGVSGQVALGLVVDTSKFERLEMRAVVAEGDFDRNNPVFPGQVADTTQDGEGADGQRIGDIESQDKGTIFLQSGQPLSKATFPEPYSLGGWSIGFTEEEHWRLFVWLSNDPDSHLEKGPPSGNPFGVVDFDMEGCGALGGYCGMREGVDVVITSTAP